jgi:hypothetical protein
MTDIKTAFISKIATQLGNLNAKYMIVTEAGDVVSNDKGFVYNPPVKFGAPARYVDSYLETMKPGDVIQIPYPHDIPADKVKQAASSRCYTMFGKGNYLTQSHDTYVEVLCTDIDPAK